MTDIEMRSEMKRNGLDPVIPISHEAPTPIHKGLYIESVDLYSFSGHLVANLPFSGCVNAAALSPFLKPRISYAQGVTLSDAG